MDMNFGENENNIRVSIITSLIFEKNLQTKMEAIDVVINSLDEETKNNTKAKKYQEYLHKLFDDENFMRLLSYNSSMKENIEYAIEYNGRDYASNPEFYYDWKFEKRLMKIKKIFNQFLGKLLDDITKGEEFEI